MTATIPQTGGNGGATERRTWSDNGGGRERRRINGGSADYGEAGRARAAVERRARGLGWFSIGLGLAQIAAPRAVARLIGVRDDDENRNTMFAIGFREITSGVGLLSQPRQPAWAWSRVGGDMMDVALLSRALKSEDSDRTRVGVATAAVLGVTLLDVLTSQQLSRHRSQAIERGDEAHGSKEVTKAITVNRPPEEVYRFWRQFDNLPRFMSHLESVQVLDERRSHWKAKAPAGKTVEWDAQITEDIPNELIAWESLEGADVANAGSVRFAPAPGGRGTELTVQMRYDPPAGPLGTIVARLFGEEPGQQVDGDLRRFKQVLETGEVVHSDASIHRGPHPARPSAAPM